MISCIFLIIVWSCPKTLTQETNLNYWHLWSFLLLWLQQLLDQTGFCILCSFNIYSDLIWIWPCLYWWMNVFRTEIGEKLHQKFSKNFITFIMFYILCFLNIKQANRTASTNRKAHANLLFISHLPGYFL